MKINMSKIRHLCSELRKEHGITKTKFGEILSGGKKTKEPRVNIERAKRFLTGQKKNITLIELERISSYFQKPLEYFLNDEGTMNIKENIKSAAVLGDTNTISISNIDSDILKKILTSTESEKQLFRKLLN